MTREMFMLFAIGYYFLTMIIIVIVLLVISNKTKKKYLAQINELERQKNLVISAGILSELNKVESLINNDDLRKKYESWQKRFNEIKNDDIPKITDLINEVQEYFETKDYANLKASIIKTEMDLNYLQTKSGILLDEIKEITLSEERNRDKITKLKAEYRNVLTTYKEDPESYSKDDCCAECGKPFVVAQSYYDYIIESADKEQNKLIKNDKSIQHKQFCSPECGQNFFEKKFPGVFVTEDRNQYGARLMALRKSRGEVSFGDKLTNRTAKNVAKHNEIAAKTNAALLSKYDENGDRKTTAQKSGGLLGLLFPFLKKFSK